MARSLFILRHAEAAEASDDFDRALTSRGRLQAGQVGAALAEYLQPPTLSIHSTARRVVETLDGVATHLPLRRDGRRNLYNAEIKILFETVRQAPDDCRSLLIVAHNPGVFMLAALLASGAWTRTDYPPAGLAVFHCEAANWPDVVPGRCALENFQIPD